MKAFNIAAAVFTWVFLVSALLYAITPANAHDYKDRSLDQWYESLHRPGVGAGGGYGATASCCSKTDCHKTDAQLRQGEWWARIGKPIDKPGGERDWELADWVKVPDHLIVRGPNGLPVRNEAGEAVICHPTVWKANNHNDPGALDPEHTTIFCFVPPFETRLRRFHYATSQP